MSEYGASDLLSEDQNRAIDVLVGGGTIKEAAKAAGVSVRTVLRWKGEPEFRTAEDRIRDAYQSAAIMRSSVKAETQVMTLESIAFDQRKKDTDRIAAIKALTDLWMKPRLATKELENIQAVPPPMIIGNLPPEVSDGDASLGSAAERPAPSAPA